MAFRWFADDERATAITIGALSSPLGCIAGIIVGPLFISEVDKT